MTSRPVQLAAKYVQEATTLVEQLARLRNTCDQLKRDADLAIKKSMDVMEAMNRFAEGVSRDEQETRSSTS